DALKRVLARAVGPKTVGGQHAAHRTDDDDAPARAGIDELADRVLDDVQVPEHFCVKSPAYEVHRDLRHRPALAGPSIVDQRVEIPFHRRRDVPRVEHVELVDHNPVLEIELCDLTL